MTAVFGNFIPKTKKPKYLKNQSWIYRIQNPFKIAMHKTMHGQKKT